MFATAVTPKIYPAEFLREVEKGLGKRGQKTLSASCFYDAIGSALFEVITLLPEYGLTRAESRLLAKSAKAMIREAGMPRMVVELGSGSGTKTRHLLQQCGEVTYRPIDISTAALDGCAAAMSGLPQVTYQPVEGSYLAGLRKALAKRDGNVLLLFLGSTIGNFSRKETQAFLRKLHAAMRPGDAFLLGADLLKPRRILLEAYDDSAGVTAAFNKNVLARINRELDGNFDLTQFRHVARFNEAESRIEMHLESTRDQTVELGALQFPIKFRQGETIWTESCHKFRAEEICTLGREAGWQVKRQWIDREWGFSETLFLA